MLKVEYNLFQLKSQLEAKNKREYSWREIADHLGIHRNTMLNFVNNKIARVDIELLTNLVLYFRQEGLRLTFFDLFTVIDSDMLTSSTASSQTYTVGSTSLHNLTAPVPGEPKNSL